MFSSDKLTEWPFQYVLTYKNIKICCCWWERERERERLVVVLFKVLESAAAATPSPSVFGGDVVAVGPVAAPQIVGVSLRRCVVTVRRRRSHRWRRGVRWSCCRRRRRCRITRWNSSYSAAQRIRYRTGKWSRVVSFHGLTINYQVVMDIVL